MKHLLFLVFCLTFLGCSQNQDFHPVDSWKIHFLDVGQGLSVLLESDGKFALYDTGPDSANFENLLKTLHVDTLEWIVISHFHRDHAGGFLEIAKKDSPFFIKQIYFGKDSTKSWIADSCISLVQEKDVPLKYLQKGDSIIFNEYPLHVLWPESERNYGDNNASLVLSSRKGNESLLLTGDIEAETEKKILDYYPSLRGALFQVPHHGSQNSSTLKFLETLQIQYAVISNAKENTYGHPHSETLKKLEAATGNSEKIFRTDSLGTVCFHWEFGTGIWPCSKNH